jgi:hypothetical protein
MVYALYRHIDYSICTLEFETRRESYYWVLEALDLYRPKVRQVLSVWTPLWIRVKYQQSRADSTRYCYENISRLLLLSADPNRKPLLLIFKCYCVECCWLLIHARLRLCVFVCRCTRCRV